MSVAFESGPRLSSIEFHCFFKSHLKSICIPCSVTTLGSYCFQSSELETLTFEAESQLGEIDYACFEECPLVSVWIPQSVEIIGEYYLSRSKIEAKTFEMRSQLWGIKKSCFAHYSLKEICVPRSVGVLGSSCFPGDEKQMNPLESITFESDPQLQTVRSCCFQFCLVKSIFIPKNVGFIEGSAFDVNKIEPVSVHEQNIRFCMIQTFLFDRIDSCTIRYFGREKTVSIWKEVKSLGNSCFASPDLENVAFHSESQFKQIQSYCFAFCSWKWICIPSSVESLGCVCFCSASVWMVIIEAESQLR
jgi:hypothetical protein